jgi:hypothetical protein
MTVREMQRAFELRFGQLDKVSDETLRRLDSTDIEMYLNLSQDRFISQRFAGNNVYQASFEESQKRIEDLRSLVKYSPEIFVASPTPEQNPTSIPNSKYFQTNIPTDYLFFVNCTANITRATINGGVAFNIGTKLIKNVEVNQFIASPYNKPIIREPLVLLIENNGILLIYESGDTLTSIRLTYLRKAKKMTSQTIAGEFVSYVNTCELPEHTHSEIVNLAVAMAYENLTGKYQIGQDQEQKTE